MGNRTVHGALVWEYIGDLEFLWYKCLATCLITGKKFLQAWLCIMEEKSHVQEKDHRLIYSG